MALHIENEANRCLGCKVPLCRKHCPINTPIPQVIRLFREGKILEAGQLLFDNNPLSLVCSIVCNHDGQCAGHCVLGKKGAPVQFYNLESYLSETWLSRTDAAPGPKKGQNVAVIGSGPAGLCAAIVLAARGYGVTVFERKADIGGMLRYGIPEFRLPRSVLDRYRVLLDQLNVQVRLNTTIGGSLKIDDLLRDGYEAIFVGTGAWRPKTLGVQGESLANVHYGVSYLDHPERQRLGKTVAVIGMGNVAMDVARTAFRNGAQRVMLFSRDNSSTATTQELQYTRLDGAEFCYGMQIVRITPEGPVFRRTILDESGQVIGMSETEVLVPADSVVIAISQGPKDKIMLSTEHLEGTAKGLAIVDENHMTTREGIFAAGDVVTGPLTVVHAVQGAKLAAQSIVRYLEQRAAQGTSP